MPTVELAGTASTRGVSGWSTNFNTARTTARDDSQYLVAAVSADNSIYFVYRAFLAFNIALPAGSVIMKANMRLTPTVKVDTSSSPHNWSIWITSANWSSYFPITSANRQNAYTVGRTATDEALLGAKGSLSVNTPKLSADLNLGRLVVGATTYYGLRISMDSSATNPGFNSNLGIQVASKAHATVGYRPVLVVEYNEPAPPTGSGKVFDIRGAIGV